MKNRIILMTIGLAMTGALIGTTPKNVHAAYYRWTKTKLYTPSIPYHAKYTGSTYMWNAHHTRVIHNLKNFPNVTWYKSAAIKMSSYGKSRIYYKVTSNDGNDTGYVWRGYLTAGINPNASGNSTGSTSTGGTGSASVATPNNGDPSKGILYSTIPYATEISGMKVTNPNPSEMASNNLLDSVNSSIVERYAQLPSETEMQLIINDAKRQFANKKDFRIVMVPYRTQDNQIVKLATLQYGENNADEENIIDSDATPDYYWVNAGLANNFLEQAKHPQVTAITQNQNDIAYLIGPRYQFPDKQAETQFHFDINLNVYEPNKNLGLIKSGYGENGEFSLVSLNEGLCYILNSDILELPQNQPIQKNGYWMGALNPETNHNFADLLSSKGIKEYREISSIDMNDFENINGSWHLVYSLMWQTDNNDFDQEKLSLNYVDEPLRTVAQVKLNSGESVMDYLFKSDSYYQNIGQNGSSNQLG